ncbi:MAG: BMP family protein, partial [Casimicrobiaceae bacterium]
FTTSVNICCAVLLASCGSNNHGAAAKVPSTFKVALLTPGPVSDQSWNAGAYEGLLRIRDSLGATISNIETKTPADFEESFRQYGAQHFSLVIGHGFEFQDAARQVAPDYPNTVFMTTSGNTEGPNLAGIQFDFANPSYLAGMLAGAVTHSNIIGVIGGTELPPVRESFAAFARGAASVNAHAKLVSSYIGNWDDVSAGREQALAQIARGVDVIFQNADAAGLGVIQAVKQSTGVWVFGSNSNQNAVAPTVMLGSVVIDLPHAFLTVAREVKAGHFRGRVISLGMKNAVVKLVINPTALRRIPAAALAQVDSVRALMEDGTFTAGNPAAQRQP